MNNPTIADDPAKDPKYAEPAIDALRAQKDEVGLLNVRLAGDHLGPVVQN